MESILRASGIKKYYGKGDTMVKALDGIDLEIELGKFTAIIGTSGSGKSTLLNMPRSGVKALHHPRRRTHRKPGLQDKR